MLGPGVKILAGMFRGSLMETAAFEQEVGERAPRIIRGRTFQVGNRSKVSEPAA